jgi:uncharacterized membrane protein YqhA
MVLGVWIYQALYESRHCWLLRLAPVRLGLAVAMIIYVAVFAGSKEQAFIYFQF